MSVHIQIDPQIGKTIRLYRKQKKLTQQALGERLDQVLASRGAVSGSGMSKSFISRIEKAQFIPPQNKLEVMVKLLDIPETEALLLFSLCGYTPPIPPDSQISRIERLQEYVGTHPEDTLSLLELVSLLNQERQFQAMQHQVVEALLRLEQSPPPASACIRGILLAKQQLGYALAERDSLQESSYLLLADRFLRQASQALENEKNLNSDSLNGLQVEILRTELSVKYRDLIKKLEQSTQKQLESGFQVLFALLQKLNELLLLLPESERRMHFNLYVQREAISLKLKKFESIERLSFQGALQELWPEYTLAENYDQQNLQVIQAILKTAGFSRKKLQSLFQNQQGVLTVSDVHLEFGSFAAWSQEFLDFLDTYQHLQKQGQGPEQLPITGILNTYLLYLSLLSRYEDFCQQGEYLLKSIYFLCKTQYLPRWHYVCTCFYAYRYLFYHNCADLDKALSSWQAWCEASPENPQNYQRSRFQALLQEPVLWVAFLQGLATETWHSAQKQWLSFALNQVG